MPAKTHLRPDRKFAEAAVENPPLPAFGRLLLALAALGALSYALRLWLTPIWSWDLWFHMKTGEWIFAHHHMPPGDLFSAAFQGKEWIVNAWLAEVLLWMSYRLAGVVGVTLFQILLSLFVFGALAHGAWRLSGRPTLSLLVTFLAAVATCSRFGARPELFTMVLMAAMLVIVYDYKFRREDRIVWLIPLGLLWANLHMGFTAAVIILGCVLAGEGLAALFCQRTGQPIPEGIIAGARLKKLALVTVAMALATLINPYGYRAWLFMAKLSGLFGNATEWSPLLRIAPTIELVPWACLLALAAITMAALLYSRRPQDLSGFLLALVFAAAALEFNRQMAQFCLVAPFVIGAAARGRRFPGEARGAIGLLAVLALEAGAWLALAFWGIPGMTAGGPFGFGLDRAKFSEGAVKFVRESGLIGSRLFNSMEEGSWIIWKLWPEQNVLIDNRMDVYGAKAVKEYLDLSTAMDVSERLKAMQIDYCYFRFPEGDEGARYPYHAMTLAYDPDWALVYFDDGAIIYARRNERNKSIIARYEYQYLNPVMTGRMASRNLEANPEMVVVEADRTLRECPESARAHLTAGMALVLIGRTDQAKERLDLARKTAVRWGPGLMGSWEDTRGRVCAIENDMEGAIEHFREAARLASRANQAPQLIAGLHNNLGRAYLKMDRLDDSEAELSMALKLDDSSASAWMNLGRVRMAQRGYREGAECFEKSIAREPNMPLTRIYLAGANVKLGNYPGALLQLEIAARMSPNLVAMAAESPDFEPIRNDPRFAALPRR